MLKVRDRRVVVFSSCKPYLYNVFCSIDWWIGNSRSYTAVNTVIHRRWSKSNQRVRGPSWLVGIVKVQSKSLESFWGSGGLALRKKLEFRSSEIVFQAISLFYKLSSYACSFREVNHDCSIRVSRSFATRHWPKRWHGLPQLCCSIPLRQLSVN